MVEFPYRKEETVLLGTVYRPIAAVHFIVEDNEILEFMYVDSGADITIIPKSMGELLGFESSREIKTIYAIGQNPIPIIIKKVQMKIGDHRFLARVGWCLQENVPFLLGRLDVFDRFSVTFDELNKKITFKPNK